MLSIELVESDMTEKDPYGINQHDPGAKLDDGKLDVSILYESFPDALRQVAAVGSYGARKYSRGGWKEVADGFRRYESAAGRHRLDRHRGQVIDGDSALLHLAHEAWNVLAMLQICVKAIEKEQSDEVRVSGVPYPVRFNSGKVNDSTATFRYPEGRRELIEKWKAEEIERMAKEQLKERMVESSRSLGEEVARLRMSREATDSAQL